MDAALHRIEGLPGKGRYAVTFRRRDGSEQTAVMETAGGEVAVAEASLPAGWTRASDVFAATAAAVLSFDRAREHASATGTLRDVDGGWDVGLGNVILGPAGIPTCVADGELIEHGAVWACETCGARAALG